jgi:hypothetical protein
MMQDEDVIQFRAREDAERDMVHEGEPVFSDEQQRAIRAESLIYTTAFSVVNRRTGVPFTSFIQGEARDEADAMARAYLTLRREFPSSEGYYPPDIKTDPNPSILVNGTHYKVAAVGA